MEIKEFQAKLKDIVELAQLNQNMLSKEMVKQFFGDSLSDEQMNNVYDYLQAQKIRVVAEADMEKEAQGLFDEERAYQAQAVEAANIDLIRASVRTKAGEPMSREEDAYIEEYTREMLCADPLSDAEVQALFVQLMEDPKAKDKLVIEKLTQQYLPKVLEIVRELHQAEYFAGDLIQEGNLALVAALSSFSKTEDPDQVICEAIREGIYESMEELEIGKWEDEKLIDRVEKLESAVKDITEAGEKISVEELSAFLDMSVEEIRDVLRLTGDDK